MGWIVVLLAVVFVFFLIRKSVDRETTKNFKHIAKIAAFFVAGLFVLLLISFIIGR